MELKDILENIMFTDKDDTITGTSQRDPLGLQPIWSYYGRRVIKHLTTVSTDIRGFRETLLCLSICGLIKEHYAEESFKSLILTFEQLFVYSAIENSTIENKYCDGILGADNGKVRFISKNGNPLVSSVDTILVREISLGYYGRYKTPLNTMGIIDRNSIVASNIDVPLLYELERYHEIYDAFEDFIKLEEDKRYYGCFKKEASKALFEAVCGKLSDGEVDFWLSRLQVTGKNIDRLMNDCYDKVDKEDECKIVFDKLQYADEAKAIEELEPFLRCMECVFYKALDSKRVQDIKFDNKMLEEHANRFEDFKKVIDSDEETSSLLADRLKYIKEKCVPKADCYIENIISYHKSVCNQKHSSFWLDYDGAGNIQTFIQHEFRVTDEEKFLNLWGRDYYMNSLRSIKKGIEALK